MRMLAERPQRTLGDEICLQGIGFITGAPVNLRLKPAREHTGIVFVRSDLPRRPRIPATVASVSGTQRRTTLGHTPAQVTLVEHILAALAGLRVDNCVLELDGPEPPGLDGSARGFVEAILKVGIVAQWSLRPCWSIQESIVIRQGTATLAIHPHDRPGLRVSYLLNYGLSSALAPQMVTVDISTDSFIHELACCRTFLLDHEAKQLQMQGVGRHLTPRELLVFGPGGPVDNGTRFADEPGRHKILDILGDLALCGVDLRGHVVAYRSGHPLNVELARTLTTSLAAQPAEGGPALRHAG